MSIRVYQPGDEAVQADIFNQATGSLPGFKPASAEDVQRRTRSRDFDPATRLLAVDAGRVVGYTVWHPSGRVSFPWCLPGHETHADTLLTACLDAMRQRGIPRAWAAYRADWPIVPAVLGRHGFAKSRDMVNFALEVSEMPTLAMKPSTAITPLRPEDVPALAFIVPGLPRVTEPAALGEYLFANPYFPSDAGFVMRSRVDQTLVAVGLLVENPAFPNPDKVDPLQPCFRMGAFGTEGLTTKRINGMFSVLIRPDGPATGRMLDLLSYAADRLESPTTHMLAAQVPSDVPHLLHAYERFFRKQGAFPVFEREV